MWSGKVEENLVQPEWTPEETTPLRKEAGAPKWPLLAFTGQFQRVPFTKPAQLSDWGTTMGAGAGGSCLMERVPLSL